MTTKEQIQSKRREVVAVRRRIYDRLVGLLAKGAASEQAVDEAELALLAAEIELLECQE